MSARDEILAALRRGGYGEQGAESLLGRAEDERLRRFQMSDARALAARHRAEVLREAAEAADSLKREDVATPTTTPDATWYDGLAVAVQLLRRMADAAGKDTPAGGESTRDAEIREQIARLVLDHPYPGEDPARFYAGLIRGCPEHGHGCEPDDHIEPPTVNGEVI